jgi:hypothetical protein
MLGRRNLTDPIPVAVSWLLSPKMTRISVEGKTVRREHGRGYSTVSCLLTQSLVGIMVAWQWGMVLDSEPIRDYSIRPALSWGMEK